MSYSIRSYCVSCDADDVINSGWSDEAYWSLFDKYNAEIEYENLSEDMAWELWTTGGFNTTEFEPDSDGCGNPIVVATMFYLTNDDTGMCIDESSGSLTADEVRDWFSEI